MIILKTCLESFSNCPIAAHLKAYKGNQKLVEMNSRQGIVGSDGSSTDFAQQVYQKADSSYRVTQEALRWTGDQPFLCELVHRLILEHPRPFPSGQEGLIVQQIVQAQIVQNWANNAAAAHLKTVLQSILDNPQKDAILNLYLHTLQGDLVFIDNSVEQPKHLLNQQLSSHPQTEHCLTMALSMVQVGAGSRC